MSSSNVLWLFLLRFSFVQSSAVHCVGAHAIRLTTRDNDLSSMAQEKAPIVTPRRHPMFHLSNGEFDPSGRITIHCQCSIPSGFGRAQNLSDQWLFLHASTFPILSSPQCRSSVLSRTSSLFSLDMGIFKDVKLDAPVSRMIASAWFPVCLIGNPDSIVPKELSFQYLHLLRHSWFVPKYCSVDFQLRLQLVSHPNQIHWFS